MKKAVGSITNPNSWHWEEKNYNTWAHDRLKALFESVKLEEKEYFLEISKCKALEGDVNTLLCYFLRLT